MLSQFVPILALIVAQPDKRLMEDQPFNYDGLAYIEVQVQLMLQDKVLSPSMLALTRQIWRYK